MQINNELLKSAILDLVYPVGSVFISFSSTNPQTYLGGTWTRLGDYFLLSTDTDSEIEDVGGESSHSHHLSNTKVAAQIAVDGGSPAGLRAAASIPNITSWQSGFKIGGSSFTSETANRTYGTPVEGNTDSTTTLPPYKKVAMFRRTA